jgi:glutamate N-acetyltransferase/amino-acid N-acetyltransferase
MIEPNMATMLAYIFTDAELDAATLDAMLRRAADVSFNMLSVDGDTSTSDTCVLMANGLAGAVDPVAFESALTAGCVHMAELLARDGEGAQHLLRVTVRNARSTGEARRIAKSLVNSPLVKTMVHGADPNVGRILMAVGKCFDCAIKPDATNAWINEHQVIGGGRKMTFDDELVRASLSNDTVDIAVDVGAGHANARAFGCDLSKGYIEENAAYYSS